MTLRRRAAAIAGAVLGSPNGLDCTQLADGLYNSCGSHAREFCARGLRFGIQTIMKQTIAALTLLVREYDEAIEFFARALGFTLGGFKSQVQKVQRDAA